MPDPGGAIDSRRPCQVCGVVLRDEEESIIWCGWRGPRRNRERPGVEVWREDYTHVLCTDCAYTLWPRVRGALLGSPAPAEAD